jgi:hypothetical protein
MEEEEQMRSSVSSVSTEALTLMVPVRDRRMRIKRKMSKAPAGVQPHVLLYP